jgi:peptide/nickel transport system permease protein
MQYILRRIMLVFPMLFGISLISFVLLNLAPGDPLTAMLNPEEVNVLSEEQLEAEREKLGLNDPLPIRYFYWLGETLQGNLGYSYNSGEPVLDRILDRLPATLLLAASAEILAAVLGLVVGTYSALRQYSFFDNVFTIFAFFAVSVPNFFFALMGIFIFAVTLEWLPVFGMWTPGEPNTFNLDLIRHAILPISALALPQVASYMRYTRSSILDARTSDHVRTARAKGLREGKIFRGHVLRNALIPMVTIFGLGLPGLIGGSFVIESIFSWPGIGELGYTALMQRDYPLQLGITLMSATVVLLANLITDLTYGIVDPRIRYE